MGRCLSPCSSRPSTTKLAQFYLNLEGLGDRRGVGMRWGRTIGSAGIWAGAPRWRGSSSGGPYNARSKNALHVSAASASSPSFASQSSLLGGLSTTDRAPPPWQRLLLLAQPADHPPGSREPGAPVTSRSSLPTAQGSFRDNTAIRAQVPGRPSLTRSPLGGKKAAFGVLRGEWAGGS